MKERRNISNICSFKFSELNSSEFSSLEDAEKSEIGKAAAEDIRDSTHTPKREVRHLCFTFDIVSGENVYPRHICYKCAADRHDFLDVQLTLKVLTHLRCVELICCDGIRVG
jgi:hypothetical protein